MKLIAQEKIFDFKKDDSLALFLSEEFNKEKGKQIPDDLSAIRERIDLSSFKGKSGETLFFPFADLPNVIIAGIGKMKEVDRESLRNSASTVTGICRKRKIKSVYILPPAIASMKPLHVITSLAEGLYLSNYSFNKYKSRKKNENSFQVERALFLTEDREASAAFREIAIVGENTLLCRDLCNELSYVSNPPGIAAIAKKIARGKNISCKVYGQRDIQKMKMGLLSAVSRGGEHPPHLVTLTYKGNPRSKKYVAFVGKGITFDTGGVNLKPTGHIESMRSDMCGAATCIYTVKAAAELKLKKNIYAVFPLCENLLSSKSYRPGDVYRAYNGKSVEIGNTDAEGRLVLADALAFTEDKLKPSYIIDIATLTGACLVSFGEIIAALITKNDTLAETLFHSGEVTGDRLWRLPLYKEYDEDIKSDIADINNISSGRNAGTIIGAVFLQNFIKNTPWAHLDIAGTSWYSKNRGYRPKYATGYGVRLFIEFMKNMEI